MNEQETIPDTIAEAVCWVARRTPERIAMQIKEEHGYRRCSFKQLIEQVEGVTSGLLRHEFRRGDRVALLSENRPEWLMAYLGIVRAGCTVIPLDIQLPRQDLEVLLKRSGTRLVFVSATTWPLLNQLDLPLTCVSFDQVQDLRCPVIGEWEQGDRPGVVRQKVLPEDVAAILYTSGTTGQPKGVCLTHRNLLSNAEAMVKTGLPNADDRFLAILPLHHAYPFMATGLVPLMLGAHITFLPTLKGPLLVQCLREAGITILVAVPQVLAMMRRGIAEGIDRRPRAIRGLIRLLMKVSGFVRGHSGINLGRILFASVHDRLGPSVRCLVSGGARLDADVAHYFYCLGFTLLEGYGLTETSPVVTFTSPTMRKSGSVGAPITGVAVRIMNPDSAGIGEVAVCGPNVMQGYDADPRASADAIRDGWFYTGDLGYLDRDGDLFLTGRAKELIVTAGGKNIAPEELEALYHRSPAIADICIAGAARPDGGGEGLHAVVLPNFEYVKQLKVGDVRQLIKTELSIIGRTLPSYKRISGLTIVRTPLPRTRLEKLQRHRVVDMIKTAEIPADSTTPPSAEDRALLETDVARGVLRTLSQFVEEKRPILLSDHLDLDLGFDSLRRVELVAVLEQSFGRLPESVVHEVVTVRELIEQVRDAGYNQTEVVRGAQSWSEILKSEPPVELRDAVLTPRSWSQRLFFTGMRALMRLGFLTGFRLRATGTEHLNQEGPCLLAANHLSILDPFVIMVSVPENMFGRLHSIGWQAFFRGAFPQWVARGGGVIPVGFEASLVPALQAGALVLRHGRHLLIFPEGQRSVDGALDQFRPGIGILACEFGVPVIPIRIDGTFDAMPIGSRWPRLHPISLAVGAPLRVTQELMTRWRSQGREPYLAATEMIRDAVVALNHDAADPEPPRGENQGL